MKASTSRIELMSDNSDRVHASDKTCSIIGPAWAARTGKVTGAGCSNAGNSVLG
jgi:hypothetical protein